MPVVNPGIRRFLGSAIQRLFNSASVSLPLTHTAIPTRGDITPSFTRATTKRIPDHEGVLRTLIAGEIGFVGARRVRNLVAASESVSGWVNASGFTVSATQFTTTATAGFLQMPLISGLNTKGVFVWSMKLACSAGDGSLAVTSIDAADGSDSTTTVLALTSTPTRYSGIVDFSASATFSGNLTLQVGNQGAATDTVKTISITEIQIEDVTAQTTQTAGEYVSVGVPSDWAGDELVTNGTFDTDLSGWTASNASLAVVANELEIVGTGSGTFPSAFQNITTVVGAKYVLTTNVRRGTCASNVFIQALGSFVATSSSTSDALLTVTFTAVGTSSNIQIGIYGTEVGTTAYLDNISVKPAYYHGSFVDGVACFDYYYLD